MGRPSLNKHCKVRCTVATLTTSGTVCSTVAGSVDRNDSSILAIWSRDKSRSTHRRRFCSNIYAIASAPIKARPPRLVTSSASAGLPHCTHWAGRTASAATRFSRQRRRVTSSSELGTKSHRPDGMTESSIGSLSNSMTHCPLSSVASSRKSTAGTMTPRSSAIRLRTPSTAAGRPDRSSAMRLTRSFPTRTTKRL